MEPIEIISENLLLRPWRAQDAPDVFGACQDPLISRWTTVPWPYEMHHAVDFVGSVAHAAWATGAQAPYGVFDASSGELLGANGLVSIDTRTGSAEIGFWTAPWARGRGVALGSTRAVANWAFDKLGLQRLIWQAEVGNHASRLVALRAGFRVEGELRLAHPHRGGRREGWIGSMLPGDVTTTTPEAYAPDSLAARRAALFGAPQPALQLTGVAGLLRPLEERDIDAVTLACQDPETAAWTTVPQPYTTADAQSFVRGHSPLVWARGQGAVFAIADADNRFVGSIDLRIDDHDWADAEIGFMTAPQARGLGYMTAAVRAMRDWGFEALRLERIQWRAFVGNEGSRKVALRSGFGWEGTLRGDCVQRGRRKDSWAAAILAGDPR